ncbi:hypothetical protein IMSAG117_01252 [Lactobacillaceae bacterium]|nr:hypothetical protein IMSAG117_01252 [Lactobacillaceae bacterium]
MATIPTIPIFFMETNPTEFTALEKTSKGLNTFAIIEDI